MSFDNAILGWEEWNIAIDYGTGPAELHTIYYGLSGQTLSMTSNETTEMEGAVRNLLPETAYDFAIAISRFIDGVWYEGPHGQIITAFTECAGETIKAKTDKRYCFKLLYSRFVLKLRRI